LGNQWLGTFTKRAMRGGGGGEKSNTNIHYLKVLTIVRGKGIVTQKKPKMRRRVGKRGIDLGGR